MFLVSYVIFQLPGTLLIKKIRAPVQFCGAMLTVTWHLSKTAGKSLANGSIHCVQWGVLTVLTILVKSSGQLIAMRFLIGAAEAFVQGGAFCTCLPPSGDFCEFKEEILRHIYFIQTFLFGTNTTNSQLELLFSSRRQPSPVPLTGCCHTGLAKTWMG